MNIRSFLNVALMLTLLIGFNHAASAQGRCYRGARHGVVVRYCPPPPIMTPPVVRYYPPMPCVARPRYYAGRYYGRHYQGRPNHYYGRARNHCR